MKAPVLRFCRAVLLFACLCIARWHLARATTSLIKYSKLNTCFLMLSILCVCNELDVLKVPNTYTNNLFQYMCTL